MTRAALALALGLAIALTPGDALAQAGAGPLTVVAHDQY